MNIEEYLKRISYEGPVSPTFDVLSNLQLNHLMTVPFENLDIQNKVRIDVTNLFDKIVTRKRGGFCYELNGLFYQLLKEIEFNVKIISARPYSEKKGYSPEFDHMALIVIINNDRYLVDVGFGEFSFQPIKIELNKESNDPRGIFRIEPLDEHYILVTKKNAEGKFLPEYKFNEKERRPEEFNGMCNYHQTSSESPFVQKRLCSLPTKTGRITLTENTIKITENGIVTERQLNSEQEVQQELWHNFGLKL